LAFTDPQFDGVFAFGVGFLSFEDELDFGHGVTL
jgi:hypothetical protein